MATSTVCPHGCRCVGDSGQVCGLRVCVCAHTCTSCLTDNETQHLIYMLVKPFAEGTGQISDALYAGFINGKFFMYTRDANNTDSPAYVTYQKDRNQTCEAGNICNTIANNNVNVGEPYYMQWRGATDQVTGNPVGDPTNFRRYDCTERVVCTRPPYRLTFLNFSLDKRFSHRAAIFAPCVGSGTSKVGRLQT